MTALEALIKARAEIAEPARWCQGAYARNSNGDQVCVGEEEACKFCGFGAIIRVTGSAEWSPVVLAASDFLDGAGRGLFITWQDSKRRKHADVMARFDRAIASAQP
jgi:hypothetical protein